MRSSRIFARMRSCRAARSLGPLSEGASSTVIASDESPAAFDDWLSTAVSQDAKDLKLECRIVSADTEVPASKGDRSSVESWWARVEIVLSG